jgi:DNA-binding transcriptional LysR family regulator
VTLTQLGAFVLVARLGSVRAAADALAISEPAVSQALGALRTHLHDPLLVRDGGEMLLTAGGARLLPIASQMVALGSEADTAVRAARGAAAQLRVIATSPLAEFVLPALVETFGTLVGGAVQVTAGVAPSAQTAALLANRLADIAIGPRVPSRPALDGSLLDSQPVFRAQLVAVTGACHTPCGNPSRWTWLVDVSGTDATSDTTRLLHRLGVAEGRTRVFPSQTAAWESAAAGHGVAVATEHLVRGRLRRHELRIIDTPATPMTADWYVTTLDVAHRPAAAGSLRQFLATPRAMHQMREPGAGVPPSKFRPPVYVTIWN